MFSHLIELSNHQLKGPVKSINLKGQLINLAAQIVWLNNMPVQADEMKYSTNL